MFRGRGPRKPKKKPVYKGIPMASKKEIEFAMDCDNRDIPWEYEPEKFTWTPPNKPRIYTPDFNIKCADGYEFLVEYKGYLRQEDKVKMQAIREQYPDLDVRFVFQNAAAPVAGAQKRKDGSKQNHSEWAEKHNFLWAEGSIPNEWLTGRRFINKLNRERIRKANGKAKGKSRKRYTNRPSGLRQNAS